MRVLFVGVGQDRRGSELLGIFLEVCLTTVIAVGVVDVFVDVVGI